MRRRRRKLAWLAFILQFSKEKGQLVGLWFDMFNNNMKSALDFKNNRSSKQFIKQQKPRGKSKGLKHCCNCSHLKSQLKELKRLQIDLSNKIKQTLSSLRQQAQFIIYSVVSRFNEVKNPNDSFNIVKNPNLKLHATQDKVQKQNKQNQGLKYSSTLKKTIFQEFKALKVLQNRSNHLRQANLQLSTMRKSLSKQSLAVCKAQNNNYKGRKDKQNANFDVFHQKVYTQEARQSSPEFGQEKKMTNNIYNSTLSKQFFSLTEKFTKQKAEFKLLKCANGHVYYRGSTDKNIPNGRGILINCCPKMPIKVKSKVVQYDGDFKNGVFEGNGVLKCKGDVRFEGCFKKGLRNGKGVIYLSQMSEAGIWQNDELKSKI